MNFGGATIWVAPPDCYYVYDYGCRNEDAGALIEFALLLLSIHRTVFFRSYTVSFLEQLAEVKLVRQAYPFGYLFNTVLGLQ